MNADSIVNDTVYYFSLPGYSLGNLIQYFLVAQDPFGNLCSLPDGAHGTNPPCTIPPTNVFSYYVSPPLNGTRTIGHINSDFPSIHAAIRALNSLSTTTGVTFRIRSGVYEEPCDTISVAAGSGLNARVVFQPADTGRVIINKQTPVVNYDGSYYGFHLINASYVTFDGSHPDVPGRNLVTLQSSDGSVNCGFEVTSGSSFNCFQASEVQSTRTDVQFRDQRIGPQPRWFERNQF